MSDVALPYGMSEEKSDESKRRAEALRFVYFKKQMSSKDYIEMMQVDDDSIREQIRKSNTPSNIEILRDAITISLEDCGINAEAKVVNFGNAIEVSDDYISIWIRTLPADDKLDVDISTIVLDETLQLKGVFTNLFDTLKSFEDILIRHLKISSVCTDEMRSWCEKNKLEKRDDDYIWR